MFDFPIGLNRRALHAAADASLLTGAHPLHCDAGAHELATATAASAS